TSRLNIYFRTNARPIDIKFLSIELCPSGRKWTQSANIIMNDFCRTIEIYLTVFCKQFRGGGRLLMILLLQLITIASNTIYRLHQSLRSHFLEPVVHITGGFIEANFCPLLLNDLSGIYSLIQKEDRASGFLLSFHNRPVNGGSTPVFRQE